MTTAPWMLPRPRCLRPGETLPLNKREQLRRFLKPAAGRIEIEPRLVLATVEVSDPNPSYDVALSLEQLNRELEGSAAHE